MTLALAILGLLSALLTAFYKWPEIKKAFSPSPESVKESIDQKVDEEEKTTNQTGRPA